MRSGRSATTRASSRTPPGPASTSRRSRRTPPPESTRLALRVAPGARRSELVGRLGDAWKLRVAAPPEDGRANAAVRRLLADALDLPRTAVTIVSGHGSRDKLVDVAGIGPDDIELRLTRATARGGKDP